MTPKYPWVSKLTLDDKIERARDLMDKILDHSQLLLRIHYSNYQLIYSDLTSKQVRRSYGAHTFNLLQATQYRFEIIRLCALWDNPSEHRESIPTLLMFLNDSVKDELQRQYAKQWERTSIFSASSDQNFGEEESQSIRDFIKESEIQFGLAEAQKSRRKLELAIKAAKALLKSKKLSALRDFRDTRLAHNLISSASTISVNDRAKYGDERYVLERTLQIVSCLNLGIRGSSFDWGRSKKLAERYAGAFWGGVSINVIE